MAVRFAADGRVFVAEKSGVIKVFDDLNDPTATVYADLRNKVHDIWDRGLLGLALDPQFTTGRPFVYALYTHDAAIGGTAPRWGDDCPTPPGANEDGCVVSARLSKLSGGSEQVLIEDWCQQFPSHSIGTLAFGADGALYAGAGDGASFDVRRLRAGRQSRQPVRGPARRAPSAPPTAEGGALRSQDARTTLGSADPGRLDHSREPGHRRGAAGQPERGAARDPNAAPDRGLRPAQPVPLHGPAGDQRHLHRRRGLEHLGGDRSAAESGSAGRELRLALLRGHAGARPRTTT